MRGAPFAVAALICLFLAGPAAAQYDPLPAGMRADAPAGDASVTARPVLKVALLSYSPPWYDASFTDETIRFIAWKMPQYRFEVTWLEAENFNKTLAKGEADIVAAPTALLQLQTAGRYRDLVTLVSNDADTNNAHAAAVITKTGRTDITALKDLTDKRVASVTSELSPGILEVAQELVSRGINAETFYKRLIRVEPLRMRKVVEMVQKGEVDAGIVRACFLEDLTRAGSGDITAGLKVIEERTGDGLTCRHTTRTYPGWVLAVERRMNETAARDITAVLLTKPANAWGQYWSIVTDYGAVDALLKDLKLGPYKNLGEVSFTELTKKYWPLAVLILIALTGLLAHGIILEKLVRHRTRELENANAEQKRAEREAFETHEQLDALQRAGTVGQISSLVAHEIKQPLAGIQNLSRGVLRRLEDSDNPDEELCKAVDAIGAEAARAGEIIDRVRSYSKGKNERRNISVKSEILRITQRFCLSGKAAGVQILLGHLEDAAVYIDPIDFELIIVNLLTNASQAVQGEAKAKVEVSSTVTGGRIEVRIRDNGPGVDAETLTKLGRSVMASSKAGSLGMGLTLVHRLCENCVGQLSFTLNTPEKGLTAHVLLPAAPACDTPQHKPDGVDP